MAKQTKGRRLALRASLRLWLSDSGLGIQRSDLTDLTLLSLLPPRLVRALRLYTDHSTAAETCQSFQLCTDYSTAVLATAHYLRAAPGYWPQLTGVEYTDYYYQIGNCNAIGRKRGAESIVLPSMRRSQVPQGVSSNR